jgi:ASC-1-like (ASCH) protein
MLHALKTQSSYFKALQTGEKNFEIRKDDRPFKVGDDIVLQEFEEEMYTGKEKKFAISYILRDVPKWGLKPGYCILGLKEKEAEY